MKFSTRFIAATADYSTFEKNVNAPCFRREFTLGKMKTAELTICGLGLYDLYINGARITRGFLSSYLTNPDDVLPFDTYNLIPYLHEGANVVGVVLGNGMLDSFGGEVWDFQTAVYRCAPKFALTFEGETAEGEKIEFDASEGFRCAPSPITLDDVRVGEFYDARLEMPGWNKPGFDDSGWTAPIPAETPRGECRLCDCDPILPQYELRPISVTKAKIDFQPHVRPNLPVIPLPEDEQNNGGYLYDFGVNAAGLCRLHIKNAKPGQKLVLQFGEHLSPDGGLDLRGMSFLPEKYNHRDLYICKGGDETWMPTFTYHGFRYCLVMGLTEEQASKDLLTYVVMNTNLTKRASFSCSDDTTNKLWNAVLVSDLANFYHFPPDCPHREKNGWTGDAALSAEQMVLALSPERNWREWCVSIRRSQNEAGTIPGIIPTSGWGFAWGNGPAWDCILTYLPYFTWKYRGDLTLARENAPAIVRYLHYMTTKLDENGLAHYGLGDWCPVQNERPTRVPLEFTDTVVCMDICHKAAKLFSLLGMKPQQLFAESIYADLRAAARSFLIDTRTLTALGRCQTTQAMAIYYNVFDDAEKPEAFRVLETLIEEKGGSFDCGILGLRVLFHVLSDFGRADLAFRMITKPDFPSYGYLIANGATSLWEVFRTIDRAPNSDNHHFFGDILSWFMQNLAGIQINPFERSCRDVRIAPKFIDPLDWAEGSVDTPDGKLVSSWKRTEDGVLLTLTVPSGVNADLVLEPGWVLDTGVGVRRGVKSGSVKIFRSVNG